MNILITIYIIIASVLLIYSINNKLDLLFIATASFLAYSMYCARGIGITGFYRPQLSVKLYLLIYMQMIIILIMTILYRNRKKIFNTTRIRKQKIFYTEHDQNNTEKIMYIAFLIYTAVIFLFSLVNIMRIGIAGFAAGKAIVWSQSNILYIISLYGAFPPFAYGIHKKHPIIWVPMVIVELFIFFAGSRAFFTTMIVIFLSQKGVELWEKNKKHLKIYIFGGCAVVFLLIYRQVDQQIMKGDFAAALTILRNPQSWLNALEFNEPRVIIANYDYVLTSGIKLPVGDIVYRIIDFIPELTKIFPIDIKYPEYFSTWLMEEVHASAGVGGTFWGENYAMFGVGGVIISTILWLLFVMLCTEHSKYPKHYSYFLVPAGAYLSWYIHRLDYNRVGQSIKVIFFCYILWALIYLIVGGEIRIFNLKIKLRHSNRFGNDKVE